MDWTTFLTWAAQALITMGLVFLASILVAGIVKGFKEINDGR